MSKKSDEPDALLCPLCKKIFTDAVLIACCGASFCDKCIRPTDPTELVQCPSCHKYRSSRTLFLIFEIILALQDESSVKIAAESQRPQIGARV